MKATCTHAICSALILLDLLKRDIDALAERLLAKAMLLA